VPTTDDRTTQQPPTATLVVPVGAGGFTTARLGPGPAGDGRYLDPAPRTPSAGRHALVDPGAPAGALPTSTWWSSLLLRTREHPLGRPLHAHPACYRLRPDGVGVDYLTAFSPAAGGPMPNTPAGEGFRQDLPPVGADDLVVGVGAPSRTPPLPCLTVEDWTDWTVVVRLAPAAGTAAPAESLRATMGHGLPFSWYEASGAAARIDVLGAPAPWLAADGALGVTVRGHDYVAYAPPGSTWAPDGNAPGRFTTSPGRFAVAVLPDGLGARERTALARRWQAYARSPVTGAVIEHEYDQQAATVRSSYRVTTAPAPQATAPAPSRGDGVPPRDTTVLALYPHQRAALTQDALPPGTPLPWTYASPRGRMAVLEGVAGFTTAVPYHGVLTELPGAAEAADPQVRERTWAYLDEIAADPLGQRDESTYWAGKALGRAARLAEVADQVGHRAVRERALDAVQDLLTDWLTAAPGKTARVFAYDETWGTLIGHPAGEFGSEVRLNDHHFHHGYFVAAAATLARFRPSWAARYGGMVDLLVRDACCDDRGDARFPYLRTFDLYAGHDWASGDADFDGGNNEESSSEAMNLLSAMIRWGETTGNRALRDTAVCLYATQADAVARYWFNADGDFPVLDGTPASGRDYASVVWGTGSQYALWFGAPDETEMFYGINVLPVTGGSLYLGARPDVVRRTWAQLLERKGGEPTLWQDVLCEYLALAEPDQAHDLLLRAAHARAATGNDGPADPGGRRSADPPDAAWEDGDSLAHAYHWVANLRLLGQVDTSVTADHPLAAVFRTAQGARSHVVTNATGRAVRVAFSDGTLVEAPPGRTVTRCGGTTTVTGGSPDAPRP